MSQVNGVMLQTFTWTPDGSGAFWTDLGERAEALAEMGFTAVWLPPACKGQGGTDDVGYGLYDLYDLGEFDQKGTVRTRYGTRDQYEACIAALKRAGLLTLADIVLNHRMGGDETERFLAVRVEDDDRLVSDSEPIELEGWTRFNFPGRAGKYSDFAWRWHHFNAIDHENPDGGGRSIYRISNKNFADDVGQELGNYDYLMGCNHHLQQSDVRDELIRWSQWVLEATGIDGFRIDAAKHMSSHFLRDLMAELPKDQADQPRFAVAEYAVDDATAICDFIRDTEGLVHAFDFPLHYRFAAAAREGEAYDLRDLFRDTMVSECPELAVTFVDNHDTEPTQGGGNFVGGIFKGSAYASILLRREGLPCVFIGDLDGRAPEAADPEKNQPEVHGMDEHGDLLRQLIRLRQRYNFGDQHDTFEDANRIAWLRTGDEDHPEAMVVVVSNGPAEPVDLDVFRPETVFTNALDPQQTVTTDDRGHGRFGGPEDGFAVWVTGDLATD